MNASRPSPMLRRCLPGILLVVACGRLWAQDEQLPKRDAGERLEFEPNLSLYDVKPDKGGPTVPWEAIPADENKAQSDDEA